MANKSFQSYPKEEVVGLVSDMYVLIDELGKNYHFKRYTPQAEAKQESAGQQQ